MRILALIALLAAPAFADPEPYRIDVERSIVGFAFDLGGQATRGTMPVTDARILLDLDTPSRSEVSATLLAARAKTGLLFATQAMRGPNVLDTSQHPQITFRSTAVTGQGDTARVDGDLTIRGTTRPVTLEARIYRQRGTTEGDRDRLSIHLSGSVSRKAFGASGFPDLVGDAIVLDILTRIDRVR